MTVGGTPPSSADPTVVLNRLDWQLGEVGRRQHRFAWLRDPSSGDWLVVDAYYPGNRVVVIATDDPALTRLCEKLVPAHDLSLLCLRSAELAGDGAELATRLRARLQTGGWQPRAEASAPAPAPAPAHAPQAPAPAQAPQAPAPAPAPSTEPPRTLAPRASRRSSGTQAEGLGVGITLVVAVSLELVVGGAVVGLDAGQYVLGVGFLLDACARVLGMVAASQAGDLDAAWTSVLFGSLALWGLTDATGSELAPLARRTAVAAGCAVALGLVILVV